MYNLPSIAYCIVLAVQSVMVTAVHHDHGGPLHLAHRETHLSRRDTRLNSTDWDRLSDLQVIARGKNSERPTAHSWFGNEGPYHNEFVNLSQEDLVLVIWGPFASWVNNNVPEITATFPRNTSLSISFADGATGAWTAVYSDTQQVNGQLSNTWGEFTFSQTGVVDVSREVNMSGHPMRIVGPQCVSDMETCVFVCPFGENVCMYDYILQNCENGSQPGANYGIHEGAPSGGCGGLGTAASLKTTFY